MKFSEKKPPRTFEAGYDKKVLISDCASLQMESNEQVTFLTESGGEYDVTKKSWGFYATPSLNGRLASFNLRAVLTKNRDDRFFIMLVEKGKEDAFMAYVNEEPMQIVAWLDSTENLLWLENKLK